MSNPEPRAIRRSAGGCRIDSRKSLASWSPSLASGTPRLGVRGGHPMEFPDDWCKLGLGGKITGTTVSSRNFRGIKLKVFKSFQLLLGGSGMV